MSPYERRDVRSKKGGATHEHRVGYVSSGTEGGEERRKAFYFDPSVRK
jgi:hypothetical protein